MDRLICILILLFATNLKAQTYDDRISLLLGEEKFFELRREYQVLKDSIDATLSDFTKAMLDHVQNRPEKACQSIESLIRVHQKSLDMNNALNMISLWGVNLMKLGKYKEAAELLSSMFRSDAIRLFADPYILEKVSDINVRAQMLKDCEPTKIERELDADCILPMIRDKNGLANITIRIKEDNVPFILDTGVDAPALISESFARKYDVKILGDSIVTDGIVGSGYTKIGFIDSLQIGNITYKNVWTLINPIPNIVHKDSIVARIDAVLGRHFFDDVGEMQILPRQNEIVFPVNHTSKMAQTGSLMLYNRQPFVELRSGEEYMAFHFDTGGSILLNASYFRKHQDFIEGSLKGDSISLGGFAGIKRMLTYKLPKLPLMIGNKTQILQSVRVLTEDTQMSSYGDGMLGMDFVDLFDKVTLNFKEMFLKVE